MHQGKQDVQLTPKMSGKEQEGNKRDSKEIHKLCRKHRQRKSRTEREVRAEGDERGMRGGQRDRGTDEEMTGWGALVIPGASH